MSADVEKLKFKIGISGTYWGKAPEYSVAISGNQYARGLISVPAGEIQYIEFDAEIADGVQRLEISLLNKELADTVKGDPDENGNITIAKDMLLNVEHIEIDDIDVGHLRYSKSHYELVKKQLYNGQIVSGIDSCVNLGWNGTYVLEFSSPFYIWLLENL